MFKSFVTLIVIVWASSAVAEECSTLSEDQVEHLLEEHIFGGAPTSDPVLVRRGYVTAYDVEHRVPRWTAWHVTPEYIDTPKREGRWSKFRTDPDTPDAVTHADFKYIPRITIGGAEDFYVRGHMAPYFISGGDRDDDGADAEIESTLAVEDLDDACTVFEVNYMTNIAPQLQRSFNGASGPWYKLETSVRKLVNSGETFHILAGSVFGDAPIKMVGNPRDERPDTIGVPHMFWKVVIWDDNAYAFLFVHDAQVHPAGDGCPLKEQDIRKCLVTIEDIELVSGVDLFSEIEGDAGLTDVGAVSAVHDRLLGEN